LVRKLKKVIQPWEKPDRVEPWAPKPRLALQQEELQVPFGRKLTMAIQPGEKPGREEPWARKPRLVPQQAERPVKLPQQGHQQEPLVQKP
jgi:hypothetical protein